MHNELYKPAIVIPAYQRAVALSELLHSINEANYPGSAHTLILSLDGGSGADVMQTVEDFNFHHGNKIVVRHDRNLGLKDHIYECCEYSKKYGSVIVLEDDLYVSPHYYSYSLESLEAYGKSERVAGISLYAQHFNETAQLPFEPMPSTWDAYFMRLASSWGQVFTHRQWQLFLEWKNLLTDDRTLALNKLPENIRKWPSSSWKKEFNLYLNQTERWISYPYKSFTTNRSHHQGRHMMGLESLFEVPVVQTSKKNHHFSFPTVKSAEIAYDTFMEACGQVVQRMTGFESENLELDLYGTKPMSVLREKKFVITSKKSGNPIKYYQHYRKPLEANLNHPSDGSNKKEIRILRLVKPKDIKSRKAVRWAYNILSVSMGQNRLLTRRFTFSHFFYFLWKKWRVLKG